MRRPETAWCRVRCSLAIGEVKTGRIGILGGTHGKFTFPAEDRKVTVDTPAPENLKNR